MAETELIPSDAMATAAARGLELAATHTGAVSLSPAATARARKISEKSNLTPAQVQRMKMFFSENKFERKAGWEQTGPGIMHMLWGGDAAKAWVASKTKALVNEGVSLEDDGKHEFAEMFFADPKPSAIEADDEGLIWKPMLPVGIWKIGPNGRPLKVVAGKSPDQRQAIGMQDVIEAFNANALPHVTIPLSHDDKVDENTGYIRKLKIATHNGIKTLFGGHHFTDKKVKNKVQEGSIANTSVGLEFDYVRKDDGKKFPIVLRHNALTNRPWLGRKLAPFGLDEADAENYVVLCGEYSEEFDENAAEDHEQVDLWDNALTYGEVRDAIVVLTDAEVIDLATDRALVKKADKNYVVNFSIEDGDVVVEDEDKWTERTVKLEENVVEDEVESEPTSGEPDTIITTSEVDTEPIKEASVPAEDKKDEGTPQGTVTPPAQVDLSEHPEMIAQREENARLKATLDQLAAKDRKNEADKIVSDLKALGLDEKHGFTEFLKFTRNIMLSDEGDTALLLSEEGSDAAPRSVTAAGLVRELLSKLPTKDGKLTIQFSEQQSDPLNTSIDDKPPADAEGDEVSLEERIEAADAWFDEAFGVTTNKKNEES